MTGGFPGRDKTIHQGIQIIQLFGCDPIEKRTLPAADFRSLLIGLILIDECKERFAALLLTVERRCVLIQIFPQRGDSPDRRLIFAGGAILRDLGSLTKLLQHVFLLRLV